MELWQEPGFGASLAAIFLKVPKALKVGGLNLLDMTFCMISADLSSSSFMKTSNLQYPLTWLSLS